MVSPSHATPLLGLSLALALSLFSPLPLSNYCCYHCCFYCIYILPTTTVVPPFLTRLSLPPISLPLLSYSSFSSLATNFSFSFSLSPPSIRYAFVGGSFGTPKIVPPHIRSPNALSSTLHLQHHYNNTITTTTTTTTTPLPLTNVVTKRRWILPLYARRYHSWKP